MNAARETLSTRCWSKQVNGGGQQQTNPPKLAQYIAEPAPDGFGALLLTPIVKEENTMMKYRWGQVFADSEAKPHIEEQGDGEQNVMLSVKPLWLPNDAIPLSMVEVSDTGEKIVYFLVPDEPI